MSIGAYIALVAFINLFRLGGAISSQIPCSKPVTYSVLNRCNWTSRTHPTDYPSNANLTPLCGAAHSKKISVVRVGGRASEGVRLVAEEGDCSVLTKSLSSCQKIGLCGTPQEYACSEMDGTCDHTGSVAVNSIYPYVSFVAMLAPSPDWFVGVGSVPLCDNGFWVQKYERSLLAYDAGTDLGKTFLSPNMPNKFRMPITRFDAMDASNIFYNRETSSLNPLCEFSLTLST